MEHTLASAQEVSEKNSIIRQYPTRVDTLYWFREVAWVLLILFASLIHPDYFYTNCLSSNTFIAASILVP